jgi:LysR family nitrogen assimilation transcriptional regulator
MTVRGWSPPVDEASPAHFGMLVSRREPRTGASGHPVLRAQSPPMDLRQLRYFVGVVEAGSLTRAAEALHVAQPALGLHIKRLEEELDVPLLLRHSRGIEPTEAGRFLLEQAQRILADVDATARALKGFGGPPRGRVALGLTPSLNATMAAPLIRRCSAALPLVTLTLAEELSSLLAEWVSAGRLDLALAYDVPESQALASTPLLREDLHLVLPPEGAASGEIPFADLAGYRLIMPGLPHTMRRLLEQTAAGRGVALDVGFEMQSVSTVKELVEGGIGATILPLGAVRREVDQGRLAARRIVEPAVTRVINLIHSRRRPLSRAETAVIALTRAVAEEAPSDRGWSMLPEG